MAGNEIEGLAVKGTMEGSSLKQGLQNLNAQMKEVKSEFTLAQAGVKDFGTSLDGMKAKSENLNKQINIQGQVVGNLKEAFARAETTLSSNIEKQNQLKIAMEQTKTQHEESIRINGKNSEETQKLAENYKKLADQYTKNEEKIKKNSTAVANANTKINNAESQLKSMRSELQDTDKAIIKQTDNWEKLSKSLKDISKGMQETGEKVGNVGSSLNKNVSAPIAAVGTIAAVTAMTYEDAMVKIAAQTGATAEAMKELEGIVQSLYGENVGEGYDDIASAMASVRQQTNLSGDALKSFTKNALSVRDIFDFDIIESTRAANMLMKQFGITSEKAFDLIAKGAQSGLNKNNDLLDSVNEYSVQFSQAGYSATDMFNMIQNGVDSGAWSVDKLVDAIKEFGSKTKENSDAMQNAYKAMGLSGEEVTSKFVNGGAAAREATNQVLTALSKMDNKIQQNEIGVQLFSTMWEDLGVKTINALSNTNGEFSNTAEVMKDINNIIYDTSKKGFESLKRDFTEIGVELGETLLPMLKDASGVLKEWSEGFKAMDEDTKKAIVTVGGVLLILGPLASGLGGILKTGGMLVGGIGKASTAISGAGGLVPALSKGVALLGPWALGVVAVGGALAVWAKNCHDAKEIQEALNNTISDTNKLKLEGIGVAQIVDATETRNKLAYELKAYNETNAAYEEVARKREVLANEYNNMMYDSSTIDQFDGDYDALKVRMKELEDQIKTTGDEEKRLFNESQNLSKGITQTYGSYDVAKKKLEVYNKELERANVEKELQNKLTDANAISINAEANELLDKARRIEVLTAEFEALNAITEPTIEQSKQLREVEEELVTIFDENVIAINKDTGAKKLNIEMCNSEIVALTNLGTASKDLVLLWTKGGIDRVKAQKDSTLKILELLKAEKEAAQSNTTQKDTSLNRYKVNAWDRAAGSMGLPTAVDKATDNAIARVSSEADRINEFINKVEGIKADGGGTYSTDSYASTAKDKDKETDPFKDALEAFELRRKIGKVAIDDEMAELQALKNKYAKSAEEKVDIEEYMYNNWLDIIERKRDLNQLSHDNEVKMLESGLKQYAYTDLQKAEISKNLLDTKIAHSQEWIEEQKYYNKLSLEEELAAYNRIKDYSKESAEYQKQMAKEIYRVEQEIKAKQVELAKETSEKNIAAKQAEYDKTIKLIEDELNKKLSSYQVQMDALQEQYDKEVELEKQKEYDKKIQDIREQMGTVRTQEEFEKLAQELNDTTQSKQEYTRQQQLKADKDLIQDKMNTAKEEATVAKQLEADKLDAYKKSQEKILAEAKNTEKSITENLREELSAREALFSNTIATMLTAMTSRLPMFTTLGATIAASLAGASSVNLSSVASNLGAVSNTNNSSSSTTNYNSNSASMQVTNIIKNANDIKGVIDGIASYVQKINRAGGK